MTTIPLSEFARLFCLVSAVALHEAKPKGETPGEYRKRLEYVATILAADERTQQLRADRATDALTLRANAMYWRQMANETRTLMAQYKLIT